MAETNWAEIREASLREFALASFPPTLQLPALPHAVTLFMQKSNDPKTTPRELTQIVETDTGLTVELLRYVNSSFIGLRQKAKNVQMALSLLGQRQSRTFLISAGMQAAVRARKSRLINQTCFWNASLQKALFAREVAKMLRTDGDIAFAGALLQDYLLPVLTNDLLEGYLPIVERRPDFAECLCDFERETFGWDHALAGASMAHRWSLPDDLVCCVLFHHRGLSILADPHLGRTPAAAVAISALLPDQLRQHYEGLEQLQILEQKWPAFNIQAIAEEVDRQQEQQGLGVRNDFPLARRCKPVLEDEARYDDGTLSAHPGGKQPPARPLAATRR